MNIVVTKDPIVLGEAAGRAAATAILDAITQKGEAHLILATGTSQLETLRFLTLQPIPWQKVTLFHLDEYIGLPQSSPASFRRYLTERFIQKVGRLKGIHLIHAEAEPQQECDRLEGIMQRIAVDLALVGIGENGHLGFNDPPADFHTRRSFLVVELDKGCRNQQLNEGWFQSLSEVPSRAITMSIPQIMKSRKIICSVPEARKAVAVGNCLGGPVIATHPASILQNHPECTCFLDEESCSLLDKTLYHGTPHLS
ncbi:MAG: glucosamine-6-phosphate deaminase [Bacteroidota bacterium]|nr:glucosamine-6-phosphate deaminase [Bacteroidota bacterium]